MSRICPECGFDVPLDRDTCPECGCPIERRCNLTIISDEDESMFSERKSHKGLWIAIIALFVVCAGAACYFFSEDLFGPKELKVTPELAAALKKYDRVEPFSEGMAAVRKGNDADGRWGYINMKGEEVIPCKYPSKNVIAGQFSEGVACVIEDGLTTADMQTLVSGKSDDYESDKKESTPSCYRIGFINKKGKWAIKGDFYTPVIRSEAGEEVFRQTLPSFKDGKCAVWSADGKGSAKIMLVDHKGKLTSTTSSDGAALMQYQPYPTSNKQYDIMARSDDSSYRLVSDTTICDNGAKLVYLRVISNKNGFSHDLVPSYGVIDKDGNSTMKPNVLEKTKVAYVKYVEKERIEKEKYEQEQERLRQEELKRQERGWLVGVWTLGKYEYPDFSNHVYVRRVLEITLDNIKLYKDGIVQYNGSYTIEDNQLQFGSHSLSIDPEMQQIAWSDSFNFTKRSDNPSASYHYATKKTSEKRNTFRGSFRSVADVWSYLSNRRFVGNGLSFTFTENYIMFKGQIVTGAPRVVSISGSCATIVATSPYFGNQTMRFYLDASNGTVINEGSVYRSR